MSAVAEKRPTRSERSQSKKTEAALAAVVSGTKTSAQALAELLNGDPPTEAPTKLRAPRKPKSKQTSSAIAAAPASTPRKRSTTSTPRVPKADLPETLAKKLKGATPAQIERVRSTLGYDPQATFAKPDGDGDILATYVPKWEQGRMKNGEFVKGPGRSFPYLIDRGGHLSGHGFKYRSTQAENKLAPVEAKNAARLQRDAKKAAA